MNNASDKDTVMARLGNLKNAEDVHRKLSVQEDHTIEDRQKIKEWKKMAEERNKEGNTQDWKVRGTLFFSKNQMNFC